MAIQRSFLPDSDSKLLAWSVQFNAGLSSHAVLYGMSTAQAAAYTALHTAFATALGVATTPSTRTAGAIAAKNDARGQLKTLARSYSQMIVANTTVTTQQKIDLGLRPRSVPQPIPTPSTSPAMTINGVKGRTVSVSVFNAASTNKKGKPAGVLGCSIFSYVGAVAPMDPSAYKFEGSTTRRNFDVQFPDSTPAGTTVWITAFWFNPTSASGPAAMPQQATIQYGMNGAAVPMKMAA